MLAAIDDGGSVLDRVYIQRAARQIVDQGTWGNLKFWGCAGLAKLRNSGGVDYVPKLYDLSGNGADLARAEDNRQPKLDTIGIDFKDNGNGVNVFSASDAINPNLHGASAITVIMWLYPQAFATGTGRNSYYLGRCDNNLGMYAIEATNSGTLRAFARSQSIDTLQQLSSSSNATTSEWQMITLVINYATPTITIYRNTSSIGSASVTFGSTTYVRTLDSTTDFIWGLVAAGRDPNATMNDIRIYNTALTATQIEAIYNETKAYYGL
jgi:hypothetical protein